MKTQIFNHAKNNNNNNKSSKRNQNPSRYIHIRTLELISSFFSQKIPSFKYPDIKIDLGSQINSPLKLLYIYIYILYNESEHNIMRPTKIKK